MSIDATPYERRVQSRNTDGTPVFANDYDKQNESEICAAIEAAWNCAVRPFGRLAVVDFYAVRDGRLVGVIEAKTRSHASARFQTVFLNVRKWLALMTAQVGLGVPALFVVRFADGIRYIRIDEVDARNFRIGGTAAIVKSHTDIEPVIEVSVQAMRPLQESS